MKLRDFSYIAVIGLVIGFGIFVTYSKPSYQPNDQMFNQLVRGNIKEGDHISIVPKGTVKGTIMGDVVHVDDTRFIFRFEEDTNFTYNETLTTDFSYADEVMGMWVVTLKGGE
jgi:hypothetical protein